MAFVNVSMDELQAQIDAMLTQGTLIHFIRQGEFLSIADCPEDVLECLADKIYKQNSAIQDWLEKLKYQTINQ
ncbi:MAG: hypothetical protein IPM37_12695 [Hahellaceae bacterium]|nr:hypothetical protein [Hahellaceae bacterium]